MASVKNRVTYTLTAVTKSLQKELKPVNQALDSVDKNAKEANTSISLLNSIELTAIIYATATLADQFTNLLENALGFSWQLDKLQAILNATDSEMASLTDEILRLGAETIMTNSEVAIGAQNLAQLGFSASETEAALSGVVNASIATGTSMDVTSRAIGSMINMFDLSAEASTHLADMLVVATNSSAANIEYMADAMKYGGATAHALGMSVEETAGAIMVMADNGLAASQAGMALRATMLRIIDPTKEVQAVFDELNITTFDAKGNFVGLVSVMEQFNKATEDATMQEKAYYASTIAGRTATSGFMAVTEDGTVAMAEYTQALENCDGAAQAAADTMSMNLRAQFEALMGSIEALVTTIVLMLEPALLAILGIFIQLTNILTEVVQLFDRLTGAIITQLNEYPKLLSIMTEALSLLRDLTIALGFVIGGYYLYTSALSFNSIATYAQTSAVNKLVKSLMAEVLALYLTNAGLLLFLAIAVIVIVALLNMEGVVNIATKAWNALKNILAILIPIMIELYNIIKVYIIQILEEWVVKLRIATVTLADLAHQVWVVIEPFVMFAAVLLYKVIYAILAVTYSILKALMPVFKALWDLVLVLIPVFIALAEIVYLLAKLAFVALYQISVALLPVFGALIEIIKLLIPPIITVIKIIYKGLVIAFALLVTMISVIVVPIILVLVNVITTYLIPILQFLIKVLQILIKVLAVVIRVLLILVNVFAVILTGAINAVVWILDNALLPILNFTIKILQLCIDAVNKLATAFEKQLKHAIEVVMIPIQLLIDAIQWLLDLILAVTDAILNGLIGAFNSIPLVPNIDTSSASTMSAYGTPTAMGNMNTVNSRSVTYNVTTSKKMTLRESLREQRLFNNHGGQLI